MLTKSLQHSLIFIVLAVLIFSSTACSAGAIPADTPTPTPLVIITSTLPPTQTPRPSATPVPPTPTVPFTPVEAQTTSQLNVRSAPSAEGELLGTVQIFDKVQIVGKDPTGGWWMILYPESPTGTGWITAQFVQATNTQDVPVFSGQAQLAGDDPATDTNSETEAGPTVEPGSVAVPSEEPTLTLATAYQDGDSTQSPAVSITLSKASVRSFNYSSDISSPAGDPEDWIQFTLDGQFGQQTNVSVILNCTGSSTMNIELIQNDSRLQSWDNIACGPPSQLLLSLFAGSPYYLRLLPSQTNNALNYINYSLLVSLQ